MVYSTEVARLSGVFMYSTEAARLSGRLTVQRPLDFLKRLSDRVYSTEPARLSKGGRRCGLQCGGHQML